MIQQYPIFGACLCNQDKAKSAEILLNLPSQPYRTVRITFIGEGRAGKTALVRGIRNGLSDVI